MAGNFTFGIEEEYFLVDAQTKSVALDMPQAFFEAARKATGGRVAGEFLQSQIEVASPVFSHATEALAVMRRYRRELADLAGEHGLTLLATSTHPLGDWGCLLYTSDAADE